MNLAYIRRAVSKRTFCSSAIRNTDFTHAVIGGGVVGLAIARQLQGRDGASTVLIERHGMVGTETSSRNSEVRLSWRAIYRDSSSMTLFTPPRGYILHEIERTLILMFK